MRERRYPPEALGGQIDGSLGRKLVWLLVLRVVIVTLLLGSGILVQINAPGTLPVAPFFLIIGLTYGLTAVYALALKYVARHRWLIDLQLGLDAVLVSAVVLMTGGIASYFSTLYVLPIVSASVLQLRRGGLLVGVLSALAYVAIVLSQYGGAFRLLEPGWLPPLGGPLPPLRVALYTTGLNVFGFLAVATLSGYLAENLQRTRARLARASTEIADLQAFHLHVIESLTSGLATTDNEFRIRTFNRAARTITGHDSLAVRGRFIFDVLQLPADVEAILRSGGEVHRVDFGYAAADGRVLEVGLSAGPIRTPSGRAGFLFTFQDVTQVKKMEREARLQQRLAAVGEMAAGIAHEIRNPLASMVGSIQILRQELPLSPEQAQLLDIVLRESERLNETIKSFLAYARPRRFATTRVDLRRLVNDTALLLRHSAECRPHHSVAVEVPAEEVWYEADEGQLRQILWNLATNGLRAMPDGGRLQLAVATEGTPPHREVIFRVGDEGVGMAPEELDRMFHPFQGAFPKGTGLGLAIVHRIVSDYGGRIQVDSAPGRGTTVQVRLPTRAAALVGS
jgi:two-component system sensor histidine kinase PilS (NtrC family)